MLKVSSAGMERLLQQTSGVTTGQMGKGIPRHFSRCVDLPSHHLCEVFGILFQVFSVFFPAVTGIVAGANLSGSGLYNVLSTGRSTQDPDLNNVLQGPEGPELFNSQRNFCSHWVYLCHLLHLLCHGWLCFSQVGPLTPPPQYQSLGMHQAGLRNWALETLATM